jgi:hypothetical protein
MLVRDALFDPIQQISSNVEIAASLVQLAWKHGLPLMMRPSKESTPLLRACIDTPLASLATTDDPWADRGAVSPASGAQGTYFARRYSLLTLFGALSSREPVSTPDRVRGTLSLENAMALDLRLISGA